MKSLLLFVLIALQLSVWGQPGNNQSTIDGLKEELRNSQPDTGRLRLLHALVSAHTTKLRLSPADSASVFAWLAEAKRLGDSLAPGFTEWKYKTLFLSVETRIIAGDFTKAKETITELTNACRAVGDRNREAESWYKYATTLMRVIKDEARIEEGINRALSIYQDIHAVKKEVEMRVAHAYLKFWSGKMDSSKKEFISLLQRAETDTAYRVPQLYHYLSAINRYEGNFNKALEYALQTVKHTKTAEDSARLHNYYGEIAEIYEALEQPAESALWYQRCIAAREQMTGYTSYFLYRTYGLLVIQLIKAGKQTEALAIINNLRQRRPPRGDADEGAFTLSLAYCYEGMGQYAMAEKYYLTCINFYDKAPVHGEYMSSAIYDVVAFYVKRQEFNKAAPLLKRLTAEGQVFASTRQQAGLQFLQFKVDSAAGNYVAAIGHLQQYKLMQDSMFNAVKSKQIEELQIQYQTEIKDQDIQLLTKKDQVQQLGLRQAATTRNTILVVTVLLVLLLALGYNRYRLKQKSNRQLEQQQHEINKQNRSLQHLVEEKEWLVKEIHHRVKNNFHIVMSLLGTQANYLKHEEAKLAMNEAQQRIHTMALIHQKLYQSENLSSINMVDYIHELVDYLRDSIDAGIRIRFDLQVAPVFLPITHSLPIGLILNEAITNSIKHAFPDDREKRIRISLQRAGEQEFVLTIADNGVGIPAHFDAINHDSMGMGLMQGLSEDIKGLFSIEQQDGTLITIRFSYKPAAGTSSLS